MAVVRGVCATWPPSRPARPTADARACISVALIIKDPYPLAWFLWKEVDTSRAGGLVQPELAREISFLHSTHASLHLPHVSYFWCTVPSRPCGM